MDISLAAKASFALYALIALGGAAVAVSCRSLVRALVGLIASLFGVAGLYLTVNAPFMALMQLLIYVGAVVVLIFFAVMLVKPTTPGDPGEEAAPTKPSAMLLAVLAGGVPALLLGAVILGTSSVELGSFALPPLVAVQELGEALMNDYVLAFELISVVLFVAMAGAVLLGFTPRGSAEKVDQGDAS